MTEISILIFLISTLCGLIYSFGVKNGKAGIENKINKAYTEEAKTIQRIRNELSKKNDDELIADYIKLLNKSNRK
jgi:hypothetical protein